MDRKSIPARKNISTQDKYSEGAAYTKACVKANWKDLLRP